MPIGLSGSRPSPVNRASIPPAAAMGITNLRVEPLSQQWRRQLIFENISLPSTIRASPSNLVFAPMAVTQSIVAFMSFERATGSILLMPLARAAQSTAL